MAEQRERVHFDKFSILITPSGYQNLRTYNVLEHRVMRFEITVVARQIDGIHKATFKRMGLFFRDAGTVLIQGQTWHATDTFKSNINMDIKYVLGASTLTIQVRNAGAIATRWNGHVDIINVK